MIHSSTSNAMFPVAKVNPSCKGGSAPNSLRPAKRLVPFLACSDRATRHQSPNYKSKRQRNNTHNTRHNATTTAPSTNKPKVKANPETYAHLSWSLHWSLSGGPIGSCPQKLRIHFRSTLLSPSPSRPESQGDEGGVGGRRWNSPIFLDTRMKRSLFSTKLLHSAARVG